MDDDDIILERAGSSNGPSMTLDADELALMNEISVTKAPKAKRVKFAKTIPVMDPVQPDIRAFSNPVKSVPRAPPPQFFPDEQDEQPEYEEQYEQPEYEEPAEQPSEGYTSVDEEKADILNKLARLEKKGHNVNKKLNAYSNIVELRTELKRIMYGIETEQSIKFSRRMLVACVTGVEFLNKRYDPFGVQLEGWSESVMENVDDYDGVFEELYHKYKTKMSVAPEIKLIMMVGGSAMMFHLTNSMFKSAIPNMNDILKQNPGLVNNMMDAVRNTQARSDPTERPPSPIDARTGRREMKGPGLDLSSLMGGIMMPPPPSFSTSQRTATVTEVEPEVIDDDAGSISDIVSMSGDSTGGEVREVKLKRAKAVRKKKVEVSL